MFFNAAVVVELCQQKPHVIHALTDWTVKVWRYGNHLTAQCMPGFYFKSTLTNSTEVYQKKRNVFCRMDGWEDVGQCEKSKLGG